jgi:hypothetical protein
MKDETESVNLLPKPLTLTQQMTLFYEKMVNNLVEC